MFTWSFWQAALERAIKTSAQVVIVLWGVGDGMFNALEIDVSTTLGIALGGFMVSVLTSLVSLGVSHGGPSLTNSETLTTK